MPSSLIWVALVAGWVLVLFPMISGSRKPVSRTGAAAEETRLLHRGGKARPVRRGPAAGHLSDPEWQPVEGEEQSRRFVPGSNDPKTTPVEAQMDSAATDSDADSVEPAVEPVAAKTRVLDAVVAQTRVLDAVVVGEEDDAPVAAETPVMGAPVAETPVVEARADEAVAEEPVAETLVGEVPEPVAEEMEHEVGDVIEDRAEEVGAVAAEEDEIRASVPAEGPVRRTGRGGFDPDADAAARAIRYRNRQRTMFGLAGATLVSIILAVVFSTLFVWGAVAFGLLLGSYMSYLRRQVRMEQQIRERRMARLQRSRRDAVAERRASATVPGEARRYGAVVLEADDEDPAFEHLPHYESTVRGHETRAAG